MDSNGFILGNLDVSGLYRVHYDSLSYSNIVKQLNTNKDVRRSIDRNLLFYDYLF
jgi:hypothetical protein